MYEVRKCFEFSAAHHLPHLPPAHPCSRPHGHNYVVEVVLQADDLSDQGFVEDYRALDDVKGFLDRQWDHQDLNRLTDAPSPTTAEHMARWLFQRFKPAHPALAAVRVSETPKTWATYRPGSQNGGALRALDDL